MAQAKDDPSKRAAEWGLVSLVPGALNLRPLPYEETDDAVVLVYSPNSSAASIAMTSGALEGYKMSFGGPSRPSFDVEANM